MLRTPSWKLGMGMNGITLKNYQGHAASDIKLAKTLTALTGKTDHGKTSVIRAIEFVRDNKPSGTAFMRKGTPKCIVSIDTVTHERTKKVNQYRIEGKKDPFKALGRGVVPEEITKALNLGDVNIQNQHDPPFLLHKMWTPGKTAKELAKLIDLKSSTNALKFIGDKKRHHKTKVGALRESIKDTELQLSKLQHVNKADKELAKIERKGAAIEKLNKKYTKLRTTHENAVQAKYELSRIPDTKALKPAKQLHKHHVELEALKSEYNELEEVTDSIVSLEHLISFDPTTLLQKGKRLQKLKSKYEELKERIIFIL